MRSITLTILKPSEEENAINDALNAVRLEL